MKDLEDKSKYENATGQMLPDKLVADCDTCAVETVYEFAHIQSGFGPIAPIPMYNCTGGCKRTRVYQTLLDKFGGRVIE